MGMQMIQEVERVTILYVYDHQVRRVRLNARHPVQETFGPTSACKRKGCFSSLCFDAGELDPLGPFLGFSGYELSEISGGQHERHAT
jgi:hypothetical protein